MKKFDYLIVGAGLFGAMFAYLANNAGKKCLLIDKRRHIGGNIYCEEIEGINVHKYGAHIFHTSNKYIWDFVNSLVEFNRYTNSPIANYKGRFFNLPFNMNTFYQMWNVTTPEDAMKILEKQRKDAKDKLIEAGLSEPRNLEEQALLLVGEDIYERLIKGYTEKQWGRKCVELPTFIIRRLPVRLTFDNNYFNDLYQGIPIGGYNCLINKLLYGIDVRLETDFFENRALFDKIANKIVFTGKIDEFFNYCFGKLEYRTVRFEELLLDTPNYQGNAVVNYTDKNVPFTRIIEHKHFEVFGDAVYDIPHTIISKEYSIEWKDGMESYYPVNDETNNTLYRRYQKLAEETAGVWFGGRLAEYKYYDMAPTIESAIKLFNKIDQDV